MMLPDEIKHLLAAADISYRVVSGKKHYKLYVAGQLVGVFPHGTRHGELLDRGGKNLVAQVRRAIRSAGRHETVRV